MDPYLTSFRLPDFATEEIAMEDETAVNVYPFKVFRNELPELEFAPVTILYGGNGSGKTTLLNVIAEALRISRDGPFNCAEARLFDKYVALCDYTVRGQDIGYPERLPRWSRYISSDDVFHRIRQERDINDERNRRRNQEFARWNKAVKPMKLDSWDKRDEFLEHMEARSTSRGTFARRHGAEDSLRQRSNGENAFAYFTEAIREDALYLLDEPENSLAPMLQTRLVEFIEESVLLNDQFIIATHSPLLLGIPGAKVYDLDQDPVRVRPWYELENVQVYRRFFLDHQDEFPEW